MLPSSSTTLMIPEELILGQSETDNSSGLTHKNNQVKGTEGVKQNLDSLSAENLSIKIILLKDLVIFFQVFQKF